MCRSRRELSNAYLLAKFGFDTAENEPCQICPSVSLVDLADGRAEARDRLGRLALRLGQDLVRALGEARA